MSRLARVVVPEIPHHVVQRGNRRQRVFFNDNDRWEYLKILGEQGRQFGLAIWAYCLMDNHVHLIVVPKREESLARGIGETHRLYTREINFRYGWRGYLWQGRFSSCPLDEGYLFQVVRYVEQNPVRAGMVARAENYPWSSAGAHARREADPVLTDFYLQEMVLDWAGYLAGGAGDDLESIRTYGRTGRPLGGKEFVRKLETLSGRVLQKKRPGPRIGNSMN